jgi:hypothetical protein
MSVCLSAFVVQEIRPDKTKYLTVLEFSMCFCIYFYLYIFIVTVRTLPLGQHFCVFVLQSYAAM